MTLLFAHHLEPQHLPVLIMMFAAGFVLGWQGVGQILGRSRNVLS